MGVTLARPPARLALDGASGSSPCCLSPTSCTPSLSASRSPRIPSLRLAATRSSGHAGQPCSHGAHTQSCTSSLCSLAPHPERLASLLLTSSPSAVLATWCTASVWPSPWLRLSAKHFVLLIILHCCSVGCHCEL